MTDIAKLLKEAPYGMELYSTLFGNVYLKGVSDNTTIAVYDKNKISRYFNKYGQYFDNFPDAECQLFPAKGQSWEDYNRIVDLLTTSSLNPYKFKVGDWIISKEKDRIYQITDIREEKYFYDNTSKYDYINVADKIYELWNINDAKPGDMLVANGAPFIYKSHDNNYVFHYCGINLGDEFIVSEKDNSIWNSNTKITPANQMQCDSLFRKMEDFGYVWDPDKKVLSKKTKFKIGDWIVNNVDKSIGQITEIICDEKDPNTLYAYEHTNGFFTNDFEDFYHLWTIKDVKDGDILSAKIDGDDYILLFKQIKDGWIETYGHYYITIDKFCVPTQLFCRDYQGTLHPATQKERYLLFKKMREAGYQWYAGKKELKKIQSHYDIANFYTGMPVLVRDTNSRKWCYLLYSHYDNTYEDGLCFNAGSVDWRQCIPFNEKTKYLLGTTDMCPEEYVNW